MTYLVEIKSFEDLKAKYREWALKLHPDMGGTDAEMQVLNNEYDQLFPIWKNRSEVHTKETADSERKWLYTKNGWEGKNYKAGRSTKAGYEKEMKLLTCVDLLESVLVNDCGLSHKKLAQIREQALDEFYKA